jgi:hypothetical protein
MTVQRPITPVISSYIKPGFKLKKFLFEFFETIISRNYLNQIGVTVNNEC